MTDSEFPFRSFTMRPEGYDSAEVDSYVAELRVEITELRRALEAATPAGDGGSDIRLHDPEGAVSRTLAIAQETADRVLHDAQVEADGRRSEADEHATTVIAEADERAARLLGDMETQAAEVREQGVAAARSAIQVERDKAMAELAHVRRVRDDLRTEAVDLKGALDQYRSQAREASDTLAAAASGPLMSLDLPAFIDDDVVLAGIVASNANDDNSDDGLTNDDVADDGVVHDDQIPAWADSDADLVETQDIDDAGDDADEAEGTYLRAVDDAHAVGESESGELADVISIDSDSDFADDSDTADQSDFDDTADFDNAGFDDTADDGDGSGTFLAEVIAAAEDDVALAPENDDSDRFLSELRGLADGEGDALDSDAADTFFDNDN